MLRVEGQVFHRNLVLGFVFELDVNLLEWNSERRKAAVNEPLTLKTAKIKVPVLTLAFRAKHQMPAAFGELIVRHKLESNNQMREKLRGKANFVNEQT